MKRPSCAKRGLVMIAVLVILALGALVGATAMHAARSSALSSSALQRSGVSRSLALSGVQAVMAELNAQRDRLLLGASPELSPGYTVFDESGRRGVARLIAWPDGALARPEPSLLNPNKATAEMLAVLPMIDEALAEAIVAERETRPFESIGDMLRVSQVTPMMIWGDGGQVSAALSSSPPESISRSAGSPPIEPSTPLADVLSVYTFEPDIQAGLGERGRDHAGNRRINLNAEWSEDLGKAIEQRYDAGAANAVRQLMENDVTFTKVSDLIAVLNNFGVDAAEWVEVLDAFTTDGHPYRVGLVDINTAPAQVLAALPGIDEDMADEIVSIRGSLGDDRRASIAWPVAEGVIATEGFGGACDWLCARSLQYRVRIEAGIERGDEDDAARSGDLSDLTLAQPIIFEAVIDLAAPRPRVAFLRDLTMLPAVAGMLGEREEVARDALAIFNSNSDGLAEPMTLDDLGEPAAMGSPSGAPGDNAFTPGDDGSGFGADDGSAHEPDGGQGGGSPSPSTGEPADNRIGRWTSG